MSGKTVVSMVGDIFDNGVEGHFNKILMKLLFNNVACHLIIRYYFIFLFGLILLLYY